MPQNKHIYSFSYSINESEICKLESRQLFGKEEKKKELDADVMIEPSHSGFIKKRLDVLLCYQDYNQLLAKLDESPIVAEQFKVEYFHLESDTTGYRTGLEKVKDIGFRIVGLPNIKNPVTTYAICYYQGYWCFGVLVKNNYEWRKHQQKPQSFSNAINIKIAKTLVNIASQGDAKKSLIDACCGVGTVLLEACFAGYQITGCDINWRVCVKSRDNLTHFGYQANVVRSDINDISESYDAAIIDLPYNLFSCADDNKLLYIIRSTSKIAQRLVIVSTTDIHPLIKQAGLQLKDSCSVKKPGKTNFERRLWVCGKR